MALKNYCVLKGNATHYRNSWQANNHYQIRIDANGNAFRIAVNVRSKLTPKDLLYIIDDDFKHPITDLVKDLPIGLNPLQSRPNSGAMDYIRGNLFNIHDMKVIPDEQIGKNNDLNDLFDFYIHKAIHEKLEVYAFGESWKPSKPKDKYFPNTPDQGIHDIHMNQGNDAAGSFSKDNGVWQDGGLLIRQSNGSWVGVFLRFQSQSIHTDDQTGMPITGQPPVVTPPVVTPPVVTPPIVTPPVITPELDTPLLIMAALVNPKGAEEGNEKVMLFNPSDADINIANWSLANNMKKKQTIGGIIKSGETMTIAMEKEVPLSNKGGIITLLNAAGLKIDGVSYTKQQAKAEGRWIKF